MLLLYLLYVNRYVVILVQIIWLAVNWQFQWNSMATNSSKASHNITNLEHRRSLPPSSCIPWLVVFTIECLAIVVLNIMAIIVFVKQRQLQRRSTYLIIHLAIVDLLVGAVSGPMQIHTFMVWCTGASWNITYFTISFAIRPFFFFASLVNLTFISLERAHATYRPFKHRLIKKWVYGLVIAFIYLLTICKGTIEGVGVWRFNNIWVEFSYLSLLVVICLCYQNPFQSSTSTQWRSWSERKKNYQYVVSCHLCIFTNFSTDTCLRWYAFTTYHSHSKIFPLFSHFRHYTNIILGQLANKSYTLCSPNARTQGRHIQYGFLQDATKTLKSSRISTSLVQAEASFFAVILIHKCK